MDNLIADAIGFVLFMTEESFPSFLFRETFVQDIF